MKRIVGVYLLTFSVFWGLTSPLWSQPDKPNIILIYADDVGYGDLSCYGAEVLQTPHLDALAKRGTRFTSAYATSSTCTPSRYSLLTGEYAFRNEHAQILPGNAPLIVDTERVTIASLLQERVGYSTGLVGKWHLGLGPSDEPLNWNRLIQPGPNECGFDYAFHMAATNDRVPTVYIKNGRVVNLDPQDPLQVDYRQPVGEDPTGLAHPDRLKMQADEQHAKTIVDGISRIGYMSGGTRALWQDAQMSDTFLQKALQFIDSNQKQPFFLLYAPYENHVPRIPHPRFRGSSGLGPRGDAVVQLDWNVGQIISKLRELEIEKNTLVIFSSDNGPVLFDGYYDGAIGMNGEHRPGGPWKGGKYSAWEAGTRVPLITWWPGVIPSGINDAMISQVDFLRSLAALTGAAVPDDQAMDSENHLEVLLGKTGVGRSRLVQQGKQTLALRSHDWKYIAPGMVSNERTIDVFKKETIEDPGALFYLPEDPLENNDLSDQYPQLVQKLGGELQDIMNKR